MKSDWLYTITPKSNFFSINFKEIWQYRDLLLLFVRRDVITVYKQTILGPLWYLIQPMFTSITFTIIFNNLAGIETGAVPPFLFNLTGITIWNYFTSCFTGTSNTFGSNSAIFGKVYFPRIISPLSLVVSSLLKFGIQLVILIVFYIYFYSNGADISLNGWVILFPILIVMMGLLSLGLGMIISSMVTKYRDLNYLVGFGVQLLMYISAVVYPMALVEQKMPDFAWVVKYNPLAYIIETTRFMFLNVGELPFFGLIYTLIITIVILLIGLLLFNKTEKNFIDTV
nr:ABC transporter permease [Flaviramulus sp.]